MTRRITVKTTSQRVGSNLVVRTTVCNGNGTTTTKTKTIRLK